MATQYFFLALYSLCMIVLVILWLQSGFDKISDYSGNYEWLKGHFAKSPLKGMVKFLLIVLCFFELSAGFAALGALVEIWFVNSWYLPFITCFLSMLSFTCLFFGQRMAKDYGSAASIAGYMAFTLLLILFTVGMTMYMNKVKL
jgi:hypothetical protein